MPDIFYSNKRYLDEKTIVFDFPCSIFHVLETTNPFNSSDLARCLQAIYYNDTLSNTTLFFDEIYNIKKVSFFCSGTIEIAAIGLAYNNTLIFTKPLLKNITFDDFSPRINNGVYTNVFYDLNTNSIKLDKFAFKYVSDLIRNFVLWSAQAAIGTVNYTVMGNTHKSAVPLNTPYDWSGYVSCLMELR